MYLSVDETNCDKYLVFFNGELYRSLVSANEEEGWIEIVDIVKMAPLEENIIEFDNALIDKDLEALNEIEGWTELPTKRMYGKVEIKKIG